MKTRKAIVFGVLLALTFIAFTGIASASNIYVRDDYSTIQAAVNAASPGDTIVVRDGTYTENVKVEKKRLTIRSENGPDSTIVEAEYPYDHVFNVTADYVNISGFTVKEATSCWNAGIYLYYADYCNISNNNCSNNENGIYLRDSNNNCISNNNCFSNDDDGISLDYSNNNSISNNNCSNNEDYGIDLWYSNNNSISNNNCLNNFEGIELSDSNNNSISNNNCSNNGAGIWLEDSSNNSISNNNCSNNWAGILLLDSNNNKLKGNVMVENGIDIWGSSLSDYLHEIDTSNTVNGKPVYYWKDVEGGRIPEGAGQVILVNCSNNAIENQDLKNASFGIQIAFSSFIAIKNNNCSFNWADGISIDYSNNNSISNNNCSNNGDGIDLRYSSNNHIYLNSFVNNTNNVNSYESTNTWNSPEKITYTYGRRTYKSHLGNHYDDYTGTDRNRDGIGDTPYQIDRDRDMYPLMKRWENYHAASELPREAIYFVLRWILED